MTIDHPLRRFLARVCSAATMARVVDPTLADMRFEDGRPTWRGCFALARALTVHVVTSAPGAMTRVYHDDGRAIPRTAAFSLIAAVAAALPLVIIPALGAFRLAMVRSFDMAPGVLPLRATSIKFLVLLLPQALAITLPAALLLAVPLAVRHRPMRRRLALRALILSPLYALGMAALVGWVEPHANERFRVVVIGDRQLPPGGGGGGLRELRSSIDKLERTPGRERLARAVEYRYQTRLALLCSPMPLSALAVALAISRFGERRPLQVGVVAMLGYLGLILPFDGAAAAAARTTSLSPIVLAWLPTAAMVIGATVLARSTPMMDEAAVR